MKRALYFLFILLLLTQCRKEDGEFLFEMPYPNIRGDFDLSAGLLFGYVLPIGPLNTNLEELLTAAMTTEEEVSVIQGASATLSSLDGVELDFIEEIRLLLCAPGDVSNCQIEVFYLDNIPFNTGSTLRLQPNITNLKDFLINQPDFRMELELTQLRDFPPQNNLRLRLDFSLEVRR